MQIKRWDIVLIDFPYTDGTITKKRPGVTVGVVLNDLGGEDVIIVAVSSVPGPTGISITEHDPEFKQSGLRRASRILPGKIFTCARSELRIPPIGVLGPDLQSKVKSRLRSILDI